MWLRPLRAITTHTTNSSQWTYMTLCSLLLSKVIGKDAGLGLPRIQNTLYMGFLETRASSFVDSLYLPNIRAFDYGIDLLYQG